MSTLHWVQSSLLGFGFTSTLVLCWVLACAGLLAFADDIRAQDPAAATTLYELSCRVIEWPMFVIAPAVTIVATLMGAWLSTSSNALLIDATPSALGSAVSIFGWRSLFR
jgi:small-conductance mechanosensitive channel